MAGIGFDLQKVLEKRTLRSYLRVYMASLAYASGPWLASILALLAIVVIGRQARVATLGAEGAAEAPPSPARPLARYHAPAGTLNCRSPSRWTSTPKRDIISQVISR